MSFTFGIYPGGAVGGDRGIVEPAGPDDPARINRALDELHGDRQGFLVRAYLPFRPPAGSGERLVPARPERLLAPGSGRRLELVLGFRDPEGDVESWLDFIREAIDTYADHIALLQICEEPTVDQPFLDGGTPNVLSALVRGVVAAREHAAERGLENVAIGFNATPTLGPDLPFWHDLAATAAKEAPDFHDALDYVGFDFFPDVFRPIPAADLARAVDLVLTDLRERVLPTAGIGPSTPIHIAENGWSTGAGRSEQRQAEVLETVLSTILGISERLNITGYSHFCLRDAVDADAAATPAAAETAAGTSADDRGTTPEESLFYGFGLLRTDYTPKPAFAVYRAACRARRP